MKFLIPTSDRRLWVEAPTAIILRGLPGVGKSTFIKSWPKVVVSADDYFTDSSGNYNFDPSQLTAAHASAFRKYITALQGLPGVVVCDNTNTTCAEMAPYILAAQAFNYTPVIIHVRVFPHHFNTSEDEARFLAARNRHGVPQSTINTMIKRWEEPLPFWPQEFMHWV